MLARVLPVAEVIQRCSELGFGVGEIFALCGPFSADFNAAFYHQCRADVVITKASGAEGDIRKSSALSGCGHSLHRYCAPDAACDG